jgi:hypothetical protein
MNLEDDPKKYPLEEYKDLSSNIRQYANMRFAQLTLFIATTVGILSIAFRTDIPLPPWIVRIGGLCVSIAFLIIERRSTKYALTYMRRAAKLEEDTLGFDQYRSVIGRGMITATNAVASLIILVAVFWLYLLLRCH